MPNSNTSKTEGSTRSLRIFLCHASSDKPKVRDLYHRLRSDGFDVWLDEENLLPGQDWQQELPKAVRQSDVVIVCLSRGSINKEGYVQKEIRFALDAADEKPEGIIFLIPLKLEDCEVPERLSRWQWVNLFERMGYDKLLRALRNRASALELTTARTGALTTLRRRLRSLRTPGAIGTVIALFALVIATLNWLAPFNPVGSSPFAPKLGTPTPQSTITDIPQTPTILPGGSVDIKSTAPLIPTTGSLTPLVTVTRVATRADATPIQTPTPSLTPSPVNVPKPTSTRSAVLTKNTPTLIVTPTPSNDYIGLVELGGRGTKSTLFTIAYQLVSKDSSVIRACLGSDYLWDRCNTADISKGSGVTTIEVEWPCSNSFYYAFGFYQRSGGTLSGDGGDSTGRVDNWACN